MFERVRLIASSVLAMRPTLRRAYGRSWPLALARAALRTGKLVQRTRWAGRNDAEASYVRTLALLAAICIDLRDRLGERAGEVMRELTTAIVEAENERVVREAGLFQISDPRQRWHAYFDRTIIHGVGKFNENECLLIDSDRIHYRVYRCVFAELAHDAGVPELGRIICDLDLPFHARLFPSFRFHRLGSARNTLAYEHACCEYVWDRCDEPGEGHSSPATRHGPACDADRSASTGAESTQLRKVS
jgi:hypothetical protein